MLYSDSQGILAPLVQSQTQFLSWAGHWAHPPPDGCSTAFPKKISAVLSEVQGDKRRVTNVFPAWVESW